MGFLVVQTQVGGSPDQVSQTGLAHVAVNTIKGISSELAGGVYLSKTLHRKVKQPWPELNMEKKCLGVNIGIILGRRKGCVLG